MSRILTERGITVSYKAGHCHIRDFHISSEKFGQFMSASGTAMMARWWNRTPQFDGLFDFQNRVRPAYFSFKLLSRLTGERLRLTSSDKSVHGFATHDKAFQTYNVLVWNFSESPVHVDLTLKDAPGNFLLRSIVLDAKAPSDDENARLNPLPRQELGKDQRTVSFELDAWGIRFTTFEPN